VGHTRIATMYKYHKYNIIQKCIIFVFFFSNALEVPKGMGCSYPYIATYLKAIEFSIAEARRIYRTRICWYVNINIANNNSNNVIVSPR
jgi:hypothetical protein